MARDESGWAWFDPLRDPTSEAVFQDSGESELPKLVSRCFNSPEGQRVLQHLRAITLGRSLGPGASDAMLRHLEGQRSLVVYLITLTARGSAGGGATSALVTPLAKPGQDPADA
jgi:hypothetical protein